MEGIEGKILAITGVMKQFLDVIFSDSESDSDDSDDELMDQLMPLKARVGRVCEVQHRIRNYAEITVPMFNDNQFQMHFRLTKQAFNHLLHHIAPTVSNLSDKGGRPTVNPKTQLLAVIWLLANPESYRSVGDRFNMGKSTLSHCFIRIIDKVSDMAPDIIRWPAAHRMDIIKRGFYRLAKIPNVLGAIDGTYVKIKAPKEFPENYINRKCFHGITLQAICDHELIFTNCFAGYPSSTSDIRIFRNSDIYHKFLNNKMDFFPNGEYILGDKAYPITDWCIPPYIERRELVDFEVHFNTHHAKTRQCIERAFALYFGRFRRLRDLNMNRTDWIPKTILACCVLHNICLIYKENMLNDYIREGQVMFNMREGNQQRHIIEDNEMGLLKRHQIARELFDRLQGFY